MRRSFLERGQRWIEQVSLNLDLARAIRASISLALALALFHFLGWSKADGLYVALTAQAIGLNDFRGGAFSRISLVVISTLAMIFAATFGGAVGHHVWGAIIGGVAVAGLSGIWRQFSTDYGPFLGVNSLLLFLLAVAGPPGRSGHLAGLIALGGLIAAGVQWMVWLARPQQQIRHALGEVWVRVSDLAGAMRWPEGSVPAGRAVAISACELELRGALDQTFTFLGAEKLWRASLLSEHLEEMRREAVHVTMRLIALNAAFEALPVEEQKRYSPTLDSALKALGDAARSTALSLVNYRAVNLTASTMRWTRSLRLWQALEAQLESRKSEAVLEDFRRLLVVVKDTVPGIRQKLATTVDHPEARWVAPVGLPEMGPRSLLGLMGWAEARWEWDPVLVRYSLRVMLLIGLAMAIYKIAAIPHGYWIALTIIIVLQPDYGSTRMRAGQRILGTLAGVAVSSVILWLNPPAGVFLLLLPLTSFGFAYFLKRQFAVGAFFVTLLVVLLTGTAGAVHLEFILWRLGCTILGGGIALLAAHFLWPTWEKEKLSRLLAAALRENARYLHALFSPADRAAEPESGILQRRHAEHANVLVAASLKRMLAEPAQRTQHSAEQVETVTYLQRLTRALTVILVDQETASMKISEPALEAAEYLEKALEALAAGAVNSLENAPEPSAIQSHLDRLEAVFGRWSVEGEKGKAPSLVRAQLMKCTAEIRAMHLAGAGLAV